jgi:hypothetical protein
MLRFVNHILALMAAAVYCVAVIAISSTILLHRLSQDPALHARGNVLNTMPVPLWWWLLLLVPPIAFLTWWFFLRGRP